MAPQPDTSDDTETDTVFFGVRMPTELKRKLKVEAAKRDKSMSAFVRDMARQVTSGTTLTNKGIDMSTQTPTPSGDSDAQESESDEGNESDNSGDESPEIVQ